jgi:hypothetical protein
MNMRPVEWSRDAKVAVQVRVIGARRFAERPAAVARDLLSVCVPEAASAMVGADAAACGATRAISIPEPVAAPEPELPLLDVARVSAIVKREVPARRAARAEALREETLVLASKGFCGAALGKVIELAKLDPDAAADLRFEPALAGLRPQVEQVLQRLIPAARTDAEKRLTRATRMAGMAELHSAGRTLPETREILRAARRFFGRGTLGGYRRSAGLAQVVIDYYGLALQTRHVQRVSKPEIHAWIPRKKTFYRIAAYRFRAAWSRVPLLLLLLAWLAMGVIGGTVYRIVQNARPGAAEGVPAEAGFGLWGIGFLAMVGFGYYARVRDIRFTLR